jgi:hypothetical protein
MGVIVDIFLLGLVVLILYLLWLIPAVSRNIRWLWSRYYAIIVTVAAALIVGFFVMPRLLK